MAIVSAVISLIAAVWFVAWLIDQAGRQAPSPWAAGLTKQQRAYIRRRARQTGRAETDVHAEWSDKRERKADASEGLRHGGANLQDRSTLTRAFPAAPPDDVEALVFGLEMQIKHLAPAGDEGAFDVQVEFHCTDCGGYEIHVPGDAPTDDDPAMCKACGRYFGTFGAVRAWARDMGRAAVRKTA